MKIYITSVFVDDQSKALDFYTRVLRFVPKLDIPMGQAHWLTVASPEEPDGTQLLLEPSSHPAVGPFKAALVRDGIPAASFRVENLDAEFARLRDLGVAFPVEPMDAGPVRMAVFDDTCGNLIQIVQFPEG